MKLSRFLFFEVSFIIVVLVLAVFFVSGDSRISANQGMRFLGSGAGSSSQVILNKTYSISPGNVMREKLGYDGRDASVISIHLVVKSVSTEGVMMIVLNGFNVAKVGITKTSIISCVDLYPKSRDLLSCVGNVDNAVRGNDTIGELSSSQTLHIVVTSSCGFDIVNPNLTNEISFISSYEGVFSFSVQW